MNASELPGAQLELTSEQIAGNEWVAYLSAEAAKLVRFGPPPAALTILQRHRIEVNTDPQRRCYDGVHAKSELRWTEWGVLEFTNSNKVDARLKFWRELNDYAVSARGESARREFKLGDETGIAQELTG